jgi:hypothetical protein
VKLVALVTGVAPTRTVIGTLVAPTGTVTARPALPSARSPCQRSSPQRHREPDRLIVTEYQAGLQPASATKITRIIVAWTFR